MKYRELRRYGRAELMELTVTLTDENDDLKREVNFLREKLEERFTAVMESGSIAEASLKVAGVFRAAQEAADIYLDHVRRVHPIPPQREAPDSAPAALAHAVHETPATQPAASDAPTQEPIPLKPPVPDWETVRSRLEEYCRIRG